MNSNQDKCTSIDLATLYRLGDLNSEENDGFEQHMLACPACHEEAIALEPVLDQLALAAPEADPPADLWGRLEQRIRNEPQDAAAQSGLGGKPWLKWEDDATVGSRLLFTWAQEGKWEPTLIEGIQARKLLVDRDNDRVTMLIRMAAGTSYPAHVHGGPEECFVLEGDLQVSDRSMGVGDYQFAPKGSEHGLQSTEKGCLLLITSSLLDLPA